MSEFLCRTALLIGEKAVEKLKGSFVAVFGIGGVGGFAAESLVRSGIGAIALFDSDTVKPSNVNRQIIALDSTIGMNKTDAMKERLVDINPAVRVETYNVFYLPETADSVDLKRFDYIIDAVDTVTAKILLAEKAKEAGIPIISCMGTGGKFNPTLLKVDDISKTSVCPLARVMRRELKKRGIDSLQVVYSEEKPITPKGEILEQSELKNGRTPPPSMIFVPATAGLILASEVVKNLVSGLVEGE